ncbi:MAG: diguanylate cyclase domain-containing protein [Snowella sp.]
MNPSLDELLDSAPCGFLSLTDDGSIVLVNRTLLELLGYEIEELIGRSIEFILPIASRIFYQTYFFPLLKMHGKTEEIYFSFKSKQGNSIPMMVNAVRRHQDDCFLNHCVVIPFHRRIQYEDEILKAKKAAEAAIASQRQTEKNLRQQYERMMLMTDITKQIRQSLNLSEIFRVSVEEIRRFLQSDRVCIYQFEPGSNLERGEFVSESVRHNLISIMATKIDDPLIGKRYVMYYRERRVQAIEDVEKAELEEYYRQFLIKLQIRATLVVLLMNNENFWGFLCIHQCNAPRYWQDFEIDLVKQIADQMAIAIQQADLFQKLQKELIERQQAQALLIQTNEELADATRRLEKLVNFDGLTQIANRRYFNERLTQEWLRLRREQQFISLLLLDVDYFKAYNDHYGHQQGDDCLIQIAHAVEAITRRPADLVARYGGEEFVAILPNTSAEGAIEMASRIHQVIKQLKIPHQKSEISDKVTVSIGIASLIPTIDQSCEILITQADKALYLAKNQGRDRSVVFGA